MTTGITDNRTWIQKAETTLASLTSGGLLLAEQSYAFMELMVKESVVLQKSTVVTMNAPKKLIEKSRFGSRVMRAGNEGTPVATADRAAPDFSKVELDAQEFLAEVPLTYDALEDNIEGERFINTVYSMLSAAIARDMDEVIVNGDTASTDPFLAKFDGILKQATSNIVNAGTVTLSKSILRDMIKAMPSEYLRSKRDMEYLTSEDAVVDFGDTVADRATGLGDVAFEADRRYMYSGIPLYGVPMFPDNLGVGTDSTNVLMLDPKNIHVGIWKNIQLRTEDSPRENKMYVLARIRFDTKYANELAVVKATNVLTQ